MQANWTEKYTELLIDMFVENRLPFSFIDSPTFRQVTQHLKCSAPVIGRKVISNHIKERYERGRLQVLLDFVLTAV
jgi:hypothetical protein